MSFTILNAYQINFGRHNHGEKERSPRKTYSPQKVSLNLSGSMPNPGLFPRIDVTSIENAYNGLPRSLMRLFPKEKYLKVFNPF